MRRPYTYPHKSKKDILDYLIKHQGYYSRHRFFPFAWNVKVYNVDYTGGWGIDGGYPINPLLNKEWDDYIKENSSRVFYSAISDVQEFYTGGEYTTYPGGDQGDWIFSFEGTGGGWLVLAKWRNVDIGQFYRCDWEGYLHELSLTDLKVLYKGIRCMDADFTRENAELNVSHAINFIRSIWEEELIDTKV